MSPEMAVALVVTESVLTIAAFFGVVLVAAHHFLKDYSNDR